MLYTEQMTNIDPDGYSVLRFGGASQARACAELGVSFGRGAALEARFLRRRTGVGPDAMRPRFARHERHVAAVLAAGGYPAIAR
jgi:hypothetical protein